MRVNPEKRGVIAIGAERFSPGDQIPQSTLKKVDVQALKSDGWLVDDVPKKQKSSPKSSPSKSAEAPAGVQRREDVEG
jgi:hypothetical protein